MSPYATPQRWIIRGIIAFMLVCIPLYLVYWAFREGELFHPPESTSPKTDTCRNYTYLDTLASDTTPVWGYRFVITGDFDGDRKVDTLTEHFLDGHTHQETNKFYNGLPDYSKLVNMTTRKEPICILSCHHTSIDTLTVIAGGFHFGLLYLKNEGDLNGDGTDEVSYVVNAADYSSLNTWHIVTYQNRKWKRLYQFDIWEWQLPELPITTTHYGLFGFDNIEVNDTDIQQITQQKDSLHTFHGLVKKIKTNLIQVVYRRMDEEIELDTMLVDLRKLQKKTK